MYYDCILRLTCIDMLFINFPNNIKDRDVADIPNYHYRDDCLKLWQAIKEYVCDVLSIFYETDEDVQKDEELQAWDLDVYE